ncbi:hypothetical protein WJX72_012526 [[Myrmecia] bisecta]|uniref:ASCH domain-containing protein n=1 Tax=[Myrmecia] bisecta TaxID=41462 RepID=A0AAW1P025_9CHLO
MDPSQPDDHAYFSEAWPAVALECQAPWCARILSGEKTVECRRYPLPSKLQGKAIWLVESCGEEGVPVLGDVVNAGDPAGTIVGWVEFAGCKAYKCEADFISDVAKHCVQPGNAFSWKAGQTEAIYGWEVGNTQTASPERQPVPGMKRIYRSLFAMERVI